MHSYLKDDVISRQKANWELSNDKRNQAQMTSEEKRRLKEQKQTFLDLRRKRLSDLLISEDIMYHNEIIRNQETPEDVRRKMEKKLNELKTQRELERQKLVKKLKEKQFYQGADELRKNDSEYFAVSCYYEQENQMLDKLKKREEEKKQENLYVKLNDLDIQKKKEKEIIQEREQKEKQQKVLDYLAWQKKQDEEELRRANEINEREKAKLKEQWKQDEEMEAQEKLNRLMQNKAVNEDIKLFNEKEEEERNRKSKIEKEQDKQLINAIVEKEKALDEIDKEEKIKRKKEYYENKKYLEYVMNQKKEAELWMDKIAQQEADKEYEKEQRQWMKEEAARIELLKQVYQDRANAIMQKKNKSEEEKKQILKERQILDEQIRQYNAKVEQLKREDFKRKKIHQDELKYQMKEKNMIQERQRQQDLYEQRAAQLWEMEYQKKINEQKMLHMQRLAEIKNRNNYD